MGTQLMSQCDVKGCTYPLTVPEEGLLPKRWRGLIITSTKLADVKAIVCPDHDKQIMAILAGKPERKQRKDKGVMKSQPAQEGVKGGNLTASTPPAVVATIPATGHPAILTHGKGKRGRKPTVKGANDKLEELTQVPRVFEAKSKTGVPEGTGSNPNVCEPGKPERTFCLGFPTGACPERKTCTLDGAKALDCWDVRTKK